MRKKVSCMIPISTMQSSFTSYVASSYYVVARVYVAKGIHNAKSIEGWPVE